jgi:NDP-sugar pyrophosphorylase family protein
VTPDETQVVVLAGGLGTRLGAAGQNRPKALQHVNGEPFLDLMLAPLLRSGFRRFCFCLGHLADQIIAHLACQQDTLSIRYHVDPRPQGTAGSLLAARTLLDEDFLLVLGDTYLDIQYPILLNAFPADALGLMVVTDMVREVPGNVELTGNQVTRYDKSLGSRTQWVDTGALVLRRRALDFLDDLARPLDLAELFIRLIARRTLRAWYAGTPFYDIGTPHRLRSFSAQAPWAPGRNRDSM